MAHDFFDLLGYIYIYMENFAVTCSFYVSTRLFSCSDLFFFIVICKIVYLDYSIKLIILVVLKCCTACLIPKGSASSF